MSIYQKEPVSGSLSPIFAAALAVYLIQAEADAAVGLKSICQFGAVDLENLMGAFDSIDARDMQLGRFALIGDKVQPKNFFFIDHKAIATGRLQLIEAA
jgi:hypothetical protein